MLNPKAENRIRQVLRVLDARRFTLVEDLTWEMAETDTVHRAPPRDATYHAFTPPAPYGAAWKCFWFHAAATVPEESRSLFLEVVAQSDSLLFLDGTPRGAFNDRHQLYPIGRDVAAGGVVDIHVEAYGGHHYPGVHPFHGDFVLPHALQERSRYPIWFEAGRLVALNEPLDQALFDLQALLETALELPEDNLRRHALIRDLSEAVHLLDPDASDETLSDQADAFRNAVRPLLAEGNPATVPDIYAVGHAHMDHAWLWPIEETTRKLARTFSTACRLAESYEEFRFIQSMPAQLEIVKREYPEVFADVQEAYRRGQWEPNGGMYVEADCNLPAGESLIRQFLYGRRTSRDLLGYEGRVTWLPDVFGYPGNLPQIMAGCGMQYFVTSKINWNDTTRFPYDLFLWEGIDGTAVPTSFIPDAAMGYNGVATPADNALSWRRVRHKDVQRSFIKPIGEGDGGGGPRREDLELARRVADLHGTPRLTWRRVGEALPDIFAAARNLPRWRGELYLEFHRGTYTSQSALKRLNHAAEEALRRLEFLASRELAQATMARADSGSAELPDPVAVEAHRRAQRDELWKQLLIHQFHDILPGSSIERVNREARTVLEAVVEAAEAQAAAYLDGPSASSSISSSSVDDDDGRREAVVVNHFGRARTSVLRLFPEEGEAVADGAQRVTDFDGAPVVLVPARLSAASVTPLRDVARARDAAAPRDTPGAGTTPGPFALDGSRVTTPFYTILFDEAGAIASLVDHDTGADLVLPGDALNTLVTARDLPVNWDAWDIDQDYELTLRPVTTAERLETVSAGAVAAIFRRVLTVGESSRVEQDTILYAHTRRIDFRTRVDWRERHTLLKASFPTAVRPPTARSGIQYGWVDRPAHRNREADAAMFEIPAQGYTALTDARRCVAVLSGEKYGYDVLDGRIRLSLLTAPTAPDETADNGVHEFTYAFLATSQPFSAPTVMSQVAELAAPPVVRARWRSGAPGSPGSASAGETAEEEGPAVGPAVGTALAAIDEDQVQLDWIKPAEDGRGIVVRLFETAGAPASVTLRTAFSLDAVERTNLLEDAAADLPSDQAAPHAGDPRAVTVRLGPFEIVTLRLIPRNRSSRRD